MINKDLKELEIQLNKELGRQKDEYLIFVDNLGTENELHIAGHFNTDTDKILVAKRYLKDYADWCLIDEFIIIEWHENIHKGIFHCIGEGGHSDEGEEKIVELIMGLCNAEEYEEKISQKSRADFKCRRKRKCQKK